MNLVAAIRLLPLLLLPVLPLAAVPAHAADPAADEAAGTGIPACDAFIAAYARCAASPGVPDNARGPLRDGIGTLRTTFRDAARNERARAALGRQCVGSHDQVRASMVAAFKCDFPASNPALADAPTTAPPGMPATAAAERGAAPPVQPASPDEQAARKANAYVRAQNRLVEHGTDKQLADHLRNNERVLKLGTKLGANAWYLFGVTPFDSIMDDLRAAIALPGTVPGVDAAAPRLLAAMEAVNPVIKQLDRYQTTRAFQDDGFRIAREKQEPLVSGLRAVIGEGGAFEAALFQRGMAQDEKRLASLPQDSLSRTLLATSLSTRRLLRQYESLGAGTSPDPFAAGLAETLAANEALHTRLDAMQPKADSDCTSYAEDIDALVGKGRDLLRDIRNRSSINQSSSDFVDRYNKSIDRLNQCRRDEARTR